MANIKKKAAVANEIKKERKELGVFGTALISGLVAFLYWLLPDLMPGSPIDDIIVILIAGLIPLVKWVTRRIRK